MAYYEHLLIYQKALALCVYLEKVVCHFSRYHKYNAGADLRKLSRRNIRLIIKANSLLTGREETLWELRENIEELKVCMRICKEVGTFRNLNSFLYAMEEVIVLARQNEAWLKSLNNKAGSGYHPPPKKNS